MNAPTRLPGSPNTSINPGPLPANNPWTHAATCLNPPFAAIGLVIFRARIRTRTRHDR